MSSPFPASFTNNAYHRNRSQGRWIFFLVKIDKKKLMCLTEYSGQTKRDQGNSQGRLIRWRDNQKGYTLLTNLWKEVR